MLTSAVCIKFGPDMAQPGTAPVSAGLRPVPGAIRINPLDANGLEAAVRLKEAHGGNVLALSLVAESPPRELVLEILAMGADSLHVVIDPAADEMDSLGAATLLSAALARLGSFDLLFCGEGSADWYDRQIGPRIAEALGIPSLTHVSDVTLEHPEVVVERVLEDRIETVASRMPVALTVTQEINDPRLPTVLQLLAAGQKPTVVWCPADLGLSSADSAGGLRIVEMRAASGGRKGVRVPGDGPDEAAAYLVRALHSEGVIGSS